MQVGVNYATFCSDNRLLPIWCQAIIWTSVDYLQIINTFQWNKFTQNLAIFNQGKVFENVICKMGPLLLDPNVRS